MKKIFLLLSLALTLNAYTQVPSYVPTIGLVAWWPFNGNANDESGNGNNGTVNGATLTSDRFGNSNEAYLFNNDSLHLDSTNFALNQFSISAWFNTSTATAYYASIFSHFVSTGVPNFTGYWIGLRGDSACFFLADGTTPGFDLKSNNTYNDGNWHLIAGTYSSGQAKLYVDGILQNSSNYFINLLPSVTEIGNNQYSEAFHGKIDDIGIWNRALTAQEVASIYSQNRGYIEIYSNSDGGLCNGKAIMHTNYSSNFTVIWSNGRTVTTTETQDSCSNLCPGPFSVSITDNVNQCSFSLSGVIQNTLSVTDPLAGYLNLANADGNAPCSGEATIIAYGGVPPYQYQFMDVNGMISGSSINVDSLCPGVYTFKIFDSQQDSLNISFLICDSSSIFSIVDPDYQDSLIVDTLIVSVMENCDIDFASVDSVWISSYSYLGTDSLMVSWNVQDSAGIHEILNYYNISNCQGVFNLELSIFCPQKSLNNPYLKAYDQLYINTQTASINSPIQEVFKVWPNPFTNELFVELTSNELTDYFIMDVFGRVVVKGTLSPAEHQLELHNLSNGIYFLCVGQKKIKIEKLLTSQH